MIGRGRSRMAAKPVRTLTENCGPTYSSSSDPRVDFFFHITEDVAEKKTIELLAQSWECHPLDTLKLVAFLRDCRNGKGIRRQYHMSLIWLFNNHYQTLVANLEQLVEFGYWKDLLHLLIILLFDGLIPEYMAIDDGKSKVKTGRKTTKKKSFPIYDRLVLRFLRKERQRQKKEMKETQRSGTPTQSDDMKSADIEEAFNVSTAEEGVPTVPTRAEALENSRRLFAQNRYNSDEKYRKLYDIIVYMFAKQLNKDLDKMGKNDKSISLAAKWAPTYRHHFDKYLFISARIGRKLYQMRGKNEMTNNSSLVSDFYQREVCSPLRKYLKIPEVYMSAQLWSEIEYNRVASKCMQKNKSLFIKHDSKRFEEFLASKKTISGAVLKPIELVDRGMKIIEKYIYLNEGEELKDDELERQVLEKQWLSLAEDIQKKGGGLLDNAIAVCDVSGSMHGEPMSAAIGLTILVMSLSSEPWNSLCITFHESPQLHAVDPNDTFLEKLKSLKEMSWGGTTNLNLVFDLILSKASEQRLTDQQMPKLLIIFTDMEFNSAFPGTSLTNFEAAKSKFNSEGYKLPPIIFWNLRGNTSLTSTPVQTNEYGAALMAGYSGQQLALILKTEDLEKMSAYSLMRSAIDHKRYANLTVID